MQAKHLALEEAAAGGTKVLKELSDELVFFHPAVQGTTSRTRDETAAGHVLIQRHQNLMDIEDDYLFVQAGVVCGVRGAKFSYILTLSSSDPQRALPPI